MNDLPQDHGQADIYSYLPYSSDKPSGIEVAPFQQLPTQLPPIRQTYRLVHFSWSSSQFCPFCTVQPLGQMVNDLFLGCRHDLEVFVGLQLLGCVDCQIHG